MKAPSEHNGVLVVNKSAAMTSHDVVDRARRLFRTKRVGHTGTLDPDATGVLVICLGQATRLAEYLSAAKKHYVSEVCFGLETYTLDASGEVLHVRDATQLTPETVLALLPAFRGTILQMPPMVSARHHEGKRLYELARQGLVVEREAREVTISELEMTAFQSGEHPIATLEITCSTGTYIRVLADDLGRAAGVGAMMKSLQRTWVGASEALAFRLQDAHTLDELQERAQSGTLNEVVLPLSAALRSWPQYRLTPEGLAGLRNGQPVAMQEVVHAAQPCSELSIVNDDSSGNQAAVLDDTGEISVIVSQTPQQLRPLKVLTQT